MKTVETVVEPVQGLKEQAFIKNFNGNSATRLTGQPPVVLSHPETTIQRYSIKGSMDF